MNGIVVASPNSANSNVPPSDQGWRHWLQTVVPLQWLPEYQAGWLPWDLVAGVTLAAYAIPVSLAYATLAGLPPERGIYCYLLGGLGYALLGTCRQLAVGPTSAIAMLVGASIGSVAVASGEPATAIAALTAMVVAMLCVLAWLLRLSGLVSFISETILTGFKAGAALTIAMTQLPKLFGVDGGSDGFFQQVISLLRQLPQTNWVVLAFGLIALAILILGEKWLPGRPVALGVVALSIIALALTDLESRGIATVGTLPPGLPAISLPPLRPRDIDGVLPLAAACFLLAYVEGVSAARTLAERHGNSVRPRQELLGLGLANLAVAFGQGFPVAGGLSQSSVNDQAGARSPLALVFASATIGACLLFLTGLLRNLPTVILAAIVLVAVRHLIDVQALRHLWRVSRYEFAIAMVALFGVLALGILQGVLLAVVVSLLVFLTAAARPHVATLGRIPGTQRYSDADRHTGNQLISGVFIFRIESSLLYFNTEHVYETVWQRSLNVPDLRLVVCDLSNAPQVDVAGAAMLMALYKALQARGVQLKVVEAHAAVRVMLRAAGLEQQVGHLARQQSLDQIITEYQAGELSGSTETPQAN